jgi:hypothetical protein
VVLVDFCHLQRNDTLRNLDRMRQLHEKYEAEGLMIVSIHAAYAAPQLPDLVAQHKIGWATAPDAGDATAAAWHVENRPSEFLIDRSGKIRFAAIYPPDLERAVQELLAEK